MNVCFILDGTSEKYYLPALENPRVHTNYMILMDHDKPL